MTVPALVMWAVVLGVGIPSAWRNPTSAALVVAWLSGQVFWLITGDSLPVDYYLYPDIFVLAIIFTKQADCDLSPYSSTWRQLQCVALERSRADRVVMLIFPVMWVLYAADIHPYFKWWLLWALAITQFLAAGFEAFESRCRDADAADQPNHMGDLLVAYRGGRFRGYG